MDEQTAAFVERMGLVLEADGLPRIAGRIFGLLLVSEKPHSLDDIADELRVSKGSASTNTRLLEQRGLLERVCRPADRRDYYNVHPDLFIHAMTQRLARWQRFHETIATARTSLSISSPVVRNRLDEYERAYTFMSQAILDALAGWQGRWAKRLSHVGAKG